MEHLCKPSEPTKRVRNFANKIREAQKLALPALASAHAKKEDSVNNIREGSRVLKVGDLLFLNLKHIQTVLKSKKEKKIMCSRKLSSHKSRRLPCNSIQLNTPSEIRLRFHVDLLKRITT